MLRIKNNYFLHNCIQGWGCREQQQKQNKQRYTSPCAFAVKLSESAYICVCLQVCAVLEAAPPQHYKYRTLDVADIDRAERAAVVGVRTKIVEDKHLILAHSIRVSDI